LEETTVYSAVLESRGEIEEYETGECLVEKSGKSPGVMKKAYHRLIASGHAPITEFMRIYKQGSEHNNGCREEHATDDSLSDNWLVFSSWRTFHHGSVNRINSERLRRGA
jgi:hypothetical protein